MTPGRLIEIFKETGALLEGHFVYASGRHGHRFLQAARVLQYPNHTQELCKSMADSFRDADVELVIGPATGGIILSYETARHLGARAAYTEKGGEGGMYLGRGFKLTPGTRVLIVEDIVTTGGSVQKSIEHLRSRDAEVVGVAVLIDRSGGKTTFDCAYKPLATIELESWPADAVPGWLQAIPIVEPDEMQV